jgi:hypothetical protein
MHEWIEHLTGDDWNSFFEESDREQELARFARRAHRQLGRGFVVVTPDDVQPIYVTWTVGAPLSLLDAIYDYNPEREALLVTHDGDDVDAVIVSVIRIETRH